VVLNSKNVSYVHLDITFRKISQPLFFLFFCSFVLMGKCCMRQDITWDSVRHKQCHPVQVFYFPQKINLLTRKTALWGIQDIILWNWICWMHTVTRSLYSKNKLIKEACLTIQSILNLFYTHFCYVTHSVFFCPFQDLFIHSTEIFSLTLCETHTLLSTRGDSETFPLSGS
jgi:hypothetical protein